MRTSIFLLILLLLTLPHSINAQTSEYGHCYGFSCYNSATQQYTYTRNSCYRAVDETGNTTYYEQYATGSLSSSNAQNTNIQGTWPTAYRYDGCGPYPPSCNLGYYAPNIPTCGGGEGGGGGGGCAPACNANGAQCTAQSGGVACPANWKNKDCADLPCAYRDECGCSACLHGCDPSCTGGGCSPTGTPTPTPTPTPYCTLQCPGTPISQFDSTGLIVPNAPMAQFAALGQGGGGGGSIQGTSSTRVLAQSLGGGGGAAAGGSMHACGDVSQALGTDPSALTFGYGSVSGNLTYMGYNAHSCSTVLGCPLDQGEACPAPTIVVQMQNRGSAVAGASDNPSLIGMVKNLTSHLLSQNMGGGAGGGSVGGGGGGSQTGTTTTWTTTKTMDRLEGSSPTLYGFTAVGASGKSCSCQVILGCQQTQQASPNSQEMELNPCESQCTFTVDASTEYPEVRDFTQFSITANEGFERNVTIDFDDGNTQALSEPFPAAATHQYENAGIYDVTLSCTNPGGNGKTCTRRLNVYCQNSGTLLTPTPTPPASWSKFKDTTLTVTGAITNAAPSGALEYDTTDRGVCDRNNPSSLECVSSGTAGATTVRGASADFGTRLSDTSWLRTDASYSSNHLITPDSFIEYAKARKDVQVLQSVTAETLVANKVNLFTGNLVLTDNALPDKLGVGDKVVLVVDGTVSIDMSSQPNDTFNPSNKPFAIISTGELEISAGTTELKGIFITNTVDFAYDATPSTSTPLKISGNLSYLQSSTSCSTKRVRTDTTYKPSCFTSFDFANQYLPLIDLLSTRTYEWTELVP